MGRNDKFKSRAKSTYQRKSKEIDDFTLQRERYVVFSLKDFDRNQGQSFKEWEQKELIALVFDKLSGLCQMTMSQAIHQQMIKVYPKVDFPPNSNFTHPRHVPEKVTWASIHIQGKECVIGYVDENIFYIVFLDENHEFWITEKKHT
jgi:hypothetical protein